MSRHEFHRRYEQHPEIKKAELIEGVVYVASPARAEQHGEPEHDIGTWLGVYKSRHRSTVRGANEATVILDLDNEPQPDLCLWHVDGNARINERGFIEGPPELIVEVAASSASYDLHAKKQAYRRNGVREYLVWRVYDAAIDWWELVEGEYVPLPVAADGIIESRAFPGLRLDTKALLAGDLEAVLRALDTRPRSR